MQLQVGRYPRDFAALKIAACHCPNARSNLRFGIQKIHYEVPRQKLINLICLCGMLEKFAYVDSLF